MRHWGMGWHGQWKKSHSPPTLARRGLAGGPRPACPRRNPAIAPPAVECTPSPSPLARDDLAGPFGRRLLGHQVCGRRALGGKHGLTYGAGRALAASRFGGGRFGPQRNRRRLARGRSRFAGLCGAATSCRLCTPWAAGGWPYRWPFQCVFGQVLRSAKGCRGGWRLSRRWQQSPGTGWSTRPTSAMGPPRQGCEGFCLGASAAASGSRGRAGCRELAQGLEPVPEESAQGQPPAARQAVRHC